MQAKQNLQQELVKAMQKDEAKGLVEWINENPKKASEIANQAAVDTLLLPEDESAEVKAQFAVSSLISAFHDDVDQLLLSSKVSGFINKSTMAERGLSSDRLTTASTMMFKRSVSLPVMGVKSDSEKYDTLLLRD